MTSSEETWDAGTALDELLSMLRETMADRQLERGLHAAALAFLARPGPEPLTARSLLDHCGRFLHEAFNTATPLREKLGARTAKTLVLSLLDQRHRAGGGGAVALADAVEAGDEGMGHLVLELAQLLADNERSLHLWWLLETRVNHLSWRQKCLLTEALLQRNGALFPDEIHRDPVSRFAPWCGELVMSAAQSGEALVRQSSSMHQGAS
jgi:hypothetical protein